MHSTYASVEECCEVHFDQYNGNCIQESIAAVEKAQLEALDQLSGPRFFWPDLVGKRNCVFDSNFKDWMVEVSRYSFCLCPVESQRPWLIDVVPVAKSLVSVSKRRGLLPDVVPKQVSGLPRSRTDGSRSSRLPG